VLVRPAPAALFGLTAALTVSLTSPSSSSAAPGVARPAIAPRVALTTVANLDQPLALAVRKGDRALWIAQQPGQVVRVSRGVATTKLDVSSQIISGGEQGLLGIAFSPGGKHLYVNVTRKPDGRTAVWDYPVSPGGKVIVAARRTLLEQPQPYANHNGGHLVTGPDGYLYIGFGDGGAGGDPQRYAENPRSWLGKILRIDPLHGNPYRVPADNPFVGRRGYKPEIWITGARNPWRFFFDKANGDLWVGDVGQGKWAEIDRLQATKGRNAGRGADLGWSAFEGHDRYNADVATLRTPVRPVHVYDHDHGCSVTGGVVYRGAAIPALRGTYLFSDFCTGGVRTLKAGQSRSGELFDDQPSSVSSFGIGPDGEAYVLSLSGTVSKIVRG
jgi:glucose/arabinose dehydrogenase